MSINIMLEMCFWSWKTDIVNKETLVNEEKSKYFLARQLGSFTMKITVPFFSSGNSYRKTSVKAYLYFLNVFFSASILGLISVLQ